MNKRVRDSVLLSSSFNIRSIAISYAANVDDLGKYHARKALTIILVIAKLLKELVLKRPAFVYFQISPLGIAFLRDIIYVTLIKIFKIKIVYHLRGQGIKEQSKIKWKKRLYEYAFRNSDIICLSKLLTSDVSDVFKGRIHIVNNGLPDIEEKIRISLKENLNGELKILYLSNLIISKGILDFIESVSLLIDKGHLFQVYIVGADGTLTAEKLKQIADDKNLSNRVHYLGAKYGMEKYRVLAQSDILVFPTKNDAFPAVVLEAMQFGLPVVATREGAIPEMIDDGVNGFLVEKGAPDQIAGKIAILDNNPTLRVQMGAAGRSKFVSQYTLHKFEENMKKVFDDVLKRQSLKK